MKRLKSEHDDETLRCYSNNQTLENRVKKLQREVEDCKHENYSLLQSVNLYKTEVQVSVFYHLYAHPSVPVSHQSSQT